MYSVIQKHLRSNNNAVSADVQNFRKLEAGEIDLATSKQMFLENNRFGIDEYLVTDEMYVNWLHTIGW